MAWYFLRQFSRISDGHPYPFYPEVPPPLPPHGAGDPLNQEIAFETINCVISDTPSWMAANFVMMNDDKMAIFGTRQQLNKLERSLSIMSGEKLVSLSEKIRNLGVILDSFLILHLHINNVIRVCVFHLRNIA